MSDSPRLLAIIELGGYPNLVPLYQELGYQVDIVNSQRKARAYLRQTIPDVIVAEYNFQSDFRDRSSNLETLMAVLQKHPGVKLIVFYMQEQAAKFDLFSQRFPVSAAIPYPITRDRVQAVLQQVR